MVSFVTDYIQNTAAGYLRTGIEAAGTMAGNAVGGVGGLIENSGRAIGQGSSGASGTVRGVGGYINGYGDKITGSMAADGPVSAKKTAVRRSPASGVAGGGAPAAARPKALPSTGGAPKALPASSAASRYPSKAPTAASRVGAGAKPSPSAIGAKPAGRVNPAGRPGLANGTVPKPSTPRPATTGAKTNPKPPSDGKVRINPSSRPKPTIKK